MRIAVIGSRGIPASYGGVERHVEELYARLAQKGCGVTVFARRHYLEALKDRVDWSRELRRGRYRGVDLVVSGAPALKGWEAFLHSFWATLLALPRRFDLYHYHATGPSFFSLLPTLLGRRVVVTCHGLDWRRAKWGGASRAYLRLCEWVVGRFARRLICVSEDLRSHFETTYQRKAEYIPNGVAVPPLPAQEDFPEWGLQSGRYIVFFGRLTPEKEVHTLLAAFKEVAYDGRLAIVGEATQAEEYGKTLRELADRRVVFPGYQYGERLNSLVANSLFVVNPSRLEGLPMTALEAHALGKRVLASDIAPHRQIIHDAQWLFPPGDVNALRDALRRILASPPAPGADHDLIERVREEYDWDRIAEMTYRYFQRVVEGK
ncbi:MAG: glycosyltransferase family 4 protein [Candidatus Sumerlaeota bacterium]|nr:glycosyltransferase family 4 protein [Candidatus Sumerlaeota bacterium]